MLLLPDAVHLCKLKVQTMCSIILILQLGLFLLTSGDFTEPSVPDLNCLNDYETEMKCNLTISELGVCSEHKLIVSIEKVKEGMYACTFEESHSITCQCTLKAQFNIGEIFKLNVSRGRKILGTKEISVEDTIKPKQPIITSVHRSDLGNFIITFNIDYSEDEWSVFLRSLTPELSYGIEGHTDYKVKELVRGSTTDELVGRYLEPNSKYVLRVRVKSDYSKNSKYSDYSEPYHFTTSSSSQNVLLIISPILCIIAIICISSMYYWYNKILKVWWVKIPTPKVATHFVKQVEQLLSFQNEFSPVCVESSLDHTVEKTRTAPCEGTNSHPGLKEHDALPAEVSSAQTGYERVQEAQCALAEEYLSTDTSATDYGNLQANSGSSFSNKLYLSSGQNCSCLRDEVTLQTSWFNQNEKVLKTLDPIISTDFDYGTCNAFVRTDPVLFGELVLVPGYQSVDEIMDHGCKGLVMEKLNCSENQEDISPSKLRPIPFVDGYQDFQSVS